MEIVFHTHHADISDHMRRRAEQALRKVARRAQRAVDAVIRFELDGETKRVELVLHTGNGRRHVARGEARFFGSALADAARRLTTQLDHGKRTPKARARRSARTARSPRADRA
jgi:ribosome-associated translation inhibitor RaiA